MAEVTGMTPAKITQEINNVKSYVDGGLSEKADKTQVASDLSKKANITDLNKKANITDLNKKADITELNKKADASYVDSELSKKVDITEGVKPGQIPRWTDTGIRWSWLDQYTNLYDNKY